MANRVPVADWAATTTWDGIQGKPDVFPSAPVDLSQVTWNGVSKNRYPVWNGVRFVPTALPSSSSSEFQTINVPGSAYRKRPLGQPSGQLQNVWDRFEANVKLWGATGNGGTNDTQAVNQAIAAVNAAGSGSLYFPAGRYVLNGDDLNQLTVTARIRGDGIGISSLLFQGGIGVVASVPDGSLSLQGISIENATVAIDAESLAFYLMECAIEASHRGIVLEGMDRGVVSDSIFTSTGTAIGIIGEFSGLSTDSLRFTDSGEWQDGIRLSAGTANIFSNVYVGNAMDAAIYLGTATSGNRVHDISFKNIAGSEPIVNLGTNNYVSDQFGLGDNANALYDSRKNLIAKFAWNPPPIPVGTGYYDDFNMPGTSFGDQVTPGFPVLIDPAVRIQAQMVASDTVRISALNLGTATIDISSGDWSLRAIN